MTVSVVIGIHLTIPQANNYLYSLLNANRNVAQSRLFRIPQALNLHSQHPLPHQYRGLKFF